MKPEINDLININRDIEFFGRTYFNSDTAGFALIKQGDKSVDVTFDREYLEQPIVNTTISFEAASSTSSGQSATSSIPVGGSGIEEQIFTNDVRFLVTNKSEKGFTILLNKPAPTDVPFSWTALAVKSAKVFSSIAVPTEIPSTVTIIPASSGQVAGAAASTISDTPTTTPAMIEEPIATSTPPTETSPTASSTPLVPEISSINNATSTETSQN